MEVTEKKFPSQRHRLLPGDDVTLTSHQHSHRHHHHHHNYRHDHHRRPLLRSSSSLLRNLVSPVVCLLLCVLVNPVLVQTPRVRSQHLFRFRGSPDANGRRNNTSALSSTPAENVVRTAAARYLIPATDRPLLLPSRTTTTMTASNMTMTTTTRSRRRPSLRKILEGEDVYWTTRRRSTNRPMTTESSVQPQPMLPIVARMRVEPVAAAEFRRRLKTARSYRDVVRIFVRSDERLRDEDIDDFIASPLMTSSAAEAGNNSNSAAAAALQSIIVGSSGRQSIEDNRLPTNEWEMTLNHYTEMQNLGDCRIPVPKFIQVRNHELARSDSDYLPECTVVYRCHKEFGCCNSTSECGVKTSTYVYRPFWEITCLPNSNCSDYPVVPVVKTFPFVNHTECECKPIRHLPRCLQCPLPFENGGREDFGRCNCSCDSQHQHCLEISSGVIPLATDEVNCVRESTCERPFCTNGEYDVETGFCPCPEDTPDCRSNHESQTQSQEDEDDDDDDDEEEIDDYVTTDETVTTSTTTTTTTTTTTSNEQLTTEEATNSSSHDQQ